MTTHKKYKPAGYWTKERCYEEALKWNTRSKYQEMSESSYRAALSKGFLDEICSHMETPGHKYSRFVYVFEFEDKHAYIGLTFNIKHRELGHLRKKDSGVYKHIQETNSKYYLRNVSGVPIPNEEAQELEHLTKLEYISNGWTILNKGITGKGKGSLGGYKIIWSLDSYEICKEEALKYKGRWEFGSNSAGAYQCARKYGWLDDICSHMVQTIKPSGYWMNKERCYNEALKYKSRAEFCDNSNGAYESVKRNGWEEDICDSIYGERTTKPSGYWTKERCYEESLKYKYKKDFKDLSAGAFNSADKNGWLEELCSNMEMNSYNCNRKPVLQYSLKGEFIKEWESIHAPSVKLNIHISSVFKCCRGEIKTGGGFIWRYKTDGYPSTIEIGIKYINPGKAVYQYTLDGKFVKKWNKAIDITKELGICYKKVSACCTGRRKSVEGFIWKFSNEETLKF